MNIDKIIDKFVKFYGQYFFCKTRTNCRVEKNVAKKWKTGKTEKRIKWKRAGVDKGIKVEIFIQK